MTPVLPNTKRYELWRLTPKRTAALLPLAGTLMLWAPPVEAQPSFQSLTNDNPSFADAITGDGEFIVGRTSSLGAVRWNVDGTVLDLGELAGSTSCTPLDISADGTVVVGYCTFAGNHEEAFRWTQAEGIVSLGDFPGGPVASRATGISTDGLTIVGSGSVIFGTRPFRWQAGIGMQELMDQSGDAIGLIASTTSADGSVAVGDRATIFGLEPFIWSQAQGIVPLAELPGDILSGDPFFDTTITPDGTVVVGTSNYGLFRWTAQGGMTQIDAGISYLTVEGVSADGMTIVARTWCCSGGEAAVISPQLGGRYLQEVLEGDYGLDMLGLDLRRANDVTDDGLTIVGGGADTTWKAYIARLAATGNGDFDADGDIDLRDFGQFQTCIEQGLVTAGCVPGDMQASGFVTIEDFGLFYDARTGPN